MQRYPYRQQPQMVDTGDVPYVSYISEQAEPLMMQAAANAQQRYDLTQTAIAKYIEENAAAKFRDVDYNTAMAKLNQDLEDIKTKVKDRYDGQYWQAYPEIVKRLSKARQTYHLAQKAYEEEQKYAPLITKLAAEKKLLFAPNAKGEVVDPRTKSIFNEKGEYVGGVDYSNIRERSDYDKTIEEAIVKGIDKTAVESGLINSKTAGYLLQLQRSGLAALGNTEQEIDNKIDKIAEEYAPIFEKQTTYGIDPNESKTSKQYVKEAIYRLASSKTGRQYMGSPLGSHPTKPTKPTKPIISGASVNADISPNPFIEEKKTTYTQSLNDFQTPWFATIFGAKKKYDNANELLDVYNNRLVEVAKKVAINTKNKNLRSELEEALNAGSNAMIGAMVGKIIASYGTAGMGGLAILPFTLKGDTRPLGQEDVLAITSAYNGLQAVTEDIKAARQNLSAQGVDVSKMNDREIAEFLDKDYTLRSKTQDVLYLTTYQGAKALSNMYNENPLGKLSGGFRIAENTDMLPLDVLAKKIGADTNQLEKQVMDSKQWNYNLDTGEFGMKLNVAKEGKEPKNKTLYFTLDNVTTEISNGLKEINVLESNPSKKRNLDEQIQKKGKGVTVSTFPGVYDVQYVGGENPYSVIYMDFETGEQDVVEDLNATQLKLFIKNRIVNPYLQYTYGED